jgi:D-alanine--poly(phosphoribitol) ligase subunit 1
MNFNLSFGFYESSLRFPDRLALSVSDIELNYGELRKRVQPLAAWLKQNSHEAAPRVGILASRSFATYAGILGSAWAGGTYVPINPKIPQQRLIQLLDQIRAECLVVDEAGLALLDENVLAHCPRLIVAPELATSPELRQKPASICVAARDAFLPFDDKDAPADAGPEHIGYIEFTSGTTGVPKGVMIPCGAVQHFLKCMQERYGLTPFDRIAGITEITFDLSVFDMFSTWKAGAGFLVAPGNQLMGPSNFLQRQKITVLLTVPSVAGSMRRMKMLGPGTLPSLRYSLFCGEPLPEISAATWQAAAPNSVVENLYGPTEATVACTWQRFAGAESATPKRGVVAIGVPLPGTELAIVDSELEEVRGEETGELLLGGAQLSAGYFGQEELTEQRFLRLRGRRWYRTGDLGYRDSSGTYHHLGRMDNQVKVRGHRVELEEVEGHLREVYGTEEVAAVAWPIEHGSASGIVAFVGRQNEAEDEQLREQMKARLPGYMLPSAVHRVESLPLNANGKVNRKDLVTLLEEGRF